MAQMKVFNFWEAPDSKRCNLDFCEKNEAFPTIKSSSQKNAEIPGPLLDSIPNKSEDFQLSQNRPNSHKSLTLFEPGQKSLRQSRNF